ncbi:MAG: outer membrane lipoprotein carrier protein LolA [Candidatus Andeanibacterium colombiense]|uniref:Outer membrane lipoprotein carrier protein LolA n=1 Tax=Candidatus Andeanibacterium colombiense TaxID=3121345 RepID=A0AAJ5X8J2_9SPHN|nr:MAG: outer membrane lipoprotein carrier protein LolA [Sphingomonadaceae bacterium]
MKTFSRSILRPVLAGALLVALPAGLLAPAAPALAASADPRFDQAVAALRGISTLRANFTQTDQNGQRVNGVLSLKQPGKIRFEYEKGANLLIVGNGSSLTMIDYEVNQVQRWPIKSSPLGALLDPSRDVARFGRVVPTSNPDVISIEVKDPKKPEYGVITLIMVRNGSAPGGYELASWVALDSQNQRTTVRLSGHRYGVAIPDSTFRYVDPRVTTHRTG